MAREDIAESMTTVVLTSVAVFVGTCYYCFWLLELQQRRRAMTMMARGPAQSTIDPQKTIPFQSLLAAGRGYHGDKTATIIWPVTS